MFEGFKMSTADKKYLTDLAKEVQKSIKTQKLPAPFSLHKKVKVEKTDTDGWEAVIGSFKEYQSSMEIWLDKFTAHEKRKIYYCIYAHKPEGIHRLIELAKPYLDAHLSISRAHLSDATDIVQLSKRMNKKDFGKPIYEKYPDEKEYFYSIYEFDKLGLKRNETKRLIERMVEFVVTINTALSKAKIKQDAEIYKAVENRKSVQRHVQRERNSHLVVLRKQHDDYQCQVCGFDYSKMYGELGIDFAEAHHIIPLSRNDKQRLTTIDDLITVCANCHRMLHRMKGRGADDVTQLKSIIRKKKSASKR